ncbi:MAG: hypothetical protein Fur0037_22100 [Planctomycetota bacterium]
MAGKDKIQAYVLSVARRGGRFVQLHDGGVPPAVARNLATVPRDEGLSMHWVSGMKFEQCHEDRACCEHLGGDGGRRSQLLGFEAADQRLLDPMRKGYQARGLPAMLRNLREAGISVEMLWFIGFSTRTRPDVVAAARWLLDHRAGFGMTAFVGDYFLHPGTEVFERQAEKFCEGRAAIRPGSGSER